MHGNVPLIKSFDNYLTFKTRWANFDANSLVPFNIEYYSKEYNKLIEDTNRGIFHSDIIHQSEYLPKSRFHQTDFRNTDDSVFRNLLFNYIDNKKMMKEYISIKWYYIFLLNEKLLNDVDFMFDAFPRHLILSIVNNGYKGSPEILKPLLNNPFFIYKIVSCDNKLKNLLDGGYEPYFKHTIGPELQEQLDKDDFSGSLESLMQYLTLQNRVGNKNPHYRKVQKI